MVTLIGDGDTTTVLAVTIQIQIYAFGLPLELLVELHSLPLITSISTMFADISPP